MNKPQTDAAIRLTQEILERYWQHDYHYAVENMAEDVVWIGCTRTQFMRGIEQVEADLAQVDQELKSCHMRNQEYMLVHNNGKTCSVAGRYLVTTDPDTDIFLQVQQRCMVIWELDEERLVIKGLYVSNPMGELALAEDETFPNHLGRRAYQYLTDSIMKEKDNHKFMVTDTKRVAHFIYENEMESLEAEKHTCYIHLQNASILINVPITRFLEEHPGKFVRVHRSYAVNPMHISHMVGSKIIMDSGREIVIADKKKGEIYDEIERFIKLQ